LGELFNGDTPRTMDGELFKRILVDNGNNNIYLDSWNIYSRIRNPTGEKMLDSIIIACVRNFEPIYLGISLVIFIIGLLTGLMIGLLIGGKK
jgi:hypothetical protein